MYLRLLLGMAGLLLAGCASTTTPPPLPSDHPANAAAAEAPLPPPSTTLVVNDAEVPHPATNPASLTPDMSGMAGMKHDMKGMQHDMKGMQHDHGMAGMSHEVPAPRPGENAAPSAPRWTPTTSPSTTTAATLYTCKMHPEVISPTPGKCPKCGMKLVLKEGK